MIRTSVIGCVVALVASLAAGCAPLRVNSYVERGADLTKYRTYAWGEKDATTTGDPRLDNNPFFENRVKADVDGRLASKGFAKVLSGADVIVYYHVSVSQQIDSNGITAPYTACEGPDCRAFVFDAGTLVVDLVDPTTKRVVWRGWATDTLEGAIDNQRYMEDRIDQAVMRIFDRLPSRN